MFPRQSILSFLTCFLLCFINQWTEGWGREDLAEPYQDVTLNNQAMRQAEFIWNLEKGVEAEESWGQ